MEIEALPLRETIESLLACSAQIKKHKKDKKNDVHLSQLREELKSGNEGYKELIKRSEAKHEYLEKHLSYLKENKKEM